jgi:iron complex outermembrane receptor protein
MKNQLINSWKSDTYIDSADLTWTPVHPAEGAVKPPQAADRASLKAVQSPGCASRAGWPLGVRFFVIATTLLTLSQLPNHVCAQAVGSGSSTSTNSTELTLDQLVNLTVTSVTRTETKLNDAPAAISVITQEDIERSGATSIPEALRMAPGMDVAQINASEWAVGARGFNSQYSDKLLVLEDGRSVYTPSFAGVVWGVQDLMLEDLDRIEVIRGPGASLWGANAVNGVVNIISKSAKDTQGLLVTTSAGTEMQPSTAIRYGDAIATNLFYRVYVKYDNADGFVNANTEGQDDWNMLRGGWRMDWEATDGDLVTFQGDAYSGDFGQYAEEPVIPVPAAPPYNSSVNLTSRMNGVDVLGRWTHDFSEDSKLTLQAYYDHAVDWDVGVEGILDTYDVDLQHQFQLGERQNIVWGAGYRFYPQENPPSPVSSFSSVYNPRQLGSAFVQDDVTLVPDRLHFIAGSKFEHNDYTGFEMEPSARLLWTPSDKQTVWGSVSRAVRTPSTYETGINFDVTNVPPSAATFGLPALIKLTGNPNLQSERLMAYELGYRVEPLPDLAFDAAGFYNHYDNLANFALGTPTPVIPPGSFFPQYVLVPETLLNTTHAESWGTELSGQWRVTDYWRLIASYSWLHMSLHPNTSSEQGDGPGNQAQIRSYLDLPHNIEVNGALYYMDDLPDIGITSYIKADLGVTWRPWKSLQIGVYGQNLLDNGHVEYFSNRGYNQAGIPRIIYGKVTCTF